MLTAIALGLAQGARHSFEPDHLAAVSVLVGESPRLRRAAWLGAVWGLGHTITLVAIGSALLMVDGALPPRADAAFELAVGAMLIGLGGRALIRAHRTEAPHAVRGAWQALLVGGVHGLAGSSALIALMFAALPTAMERILYISLFGLGSIAGMAAVSVITGAWLERLRRSWLAAAILVISAMWSIGIGLTIVVRTACA